MTKTYLIGLTKDEIAAKLQEIGMEKFRAKQIWHWLYAKGVTDFAQMTTIAMADEYQCPEPILVIVGRRAGQRVRPMRVFVCPRGETAKEILPQPSDLRPN